MNQPHNPISGSRRCETAAGVGEPPIYNGGYGAQGADAEREVILGRIREALAGGGTAPVRSGVSGAGARQGASPAAGKREWLPFVGGSFEAQLAAFRQNAEMLKAGFHTASNREELKQRLTDLRAAEGWKRIAAHQGELTDFAVSVLGLPVLKTVSGYDRNELERCDAGITGCDALIAQTGSVLVTSRSAGGRALSVLPPHHVVLARAGQLLRDLPAAFELLKQKYAPGYPSMISFITGPSRTGDIERILVLGAHGPKKLTIFMLS